MKRIEVLRKAESEGEGAPPTEMSKHQVISQAKLRALIRSKLKNAEDIGELSGSIGGEIKHAVDKLHLDKKMFGWICQLAGMTDEKLSDHLTNLEHYLDISGLNERAAKVQKLDLGDQSGDEEGDKSKGRGRGGRGSNVKPFPKPDGESSD